MLTDREPTQDAQNTEVEYDCNSVGIELYDSLIDRALNDPSIKSAYDEAQRARYGANPGYRSQHIEIGVTTKTGVKTKASFYLYPGPNYPSARVTFEELESAMPHKISVSVDSGDFDASSNFTSGNLSNTLEAETAFRKALVHFFGE